MNRVLLSGLLEITSYLLPEDSFLSSINSISESVLLDSATTDVSLELPGALAEPGVLRAEESSWTKGVG